MHTTAAISTEAFITALYKFEQHGANLQAYHAVMANIPLENFVGTYREEIIRRCQAKVASREPPPGKTDSSRFGVARFLDQLCEQLRDGDEHSHEIGNTAKKHGHDLLTQGFTIDQVVHDYGDVCQSITDLAVELGAPISTNDFRTLNRCLDNAIAGAVTHSRQDKASRAPKSRPNSTAWLRPRFAPSVLSGVAVWERVAVRGPWLSGISLPSSPLWMTNRPNRSRRANV